MEDDLESLFEAFAKSRSLSFASFKHTWRLLEFSLLHSELIDPDSTEETEKVYQDFFATILSYLSRPVHLRWKVASVYTLYLMHTTQPQAQPIPIRIGPNEWRRLQNLVAACSPLSQLCDVLPVLQILRRSGALLPAAYAGPVNYASIARTARLYGLHDTLMCRGPSGPLIDHVGYGLFPEVMAKLQTSTSGNALTDVVEEGSRPKLAQDRRRRAARSTSVLAGSKRPATCDGEDGVTETLLGASASVTSMQLGGLKATMAAKRDTLTRQKSRTAGALLATVGIVRPPVDAVQAKSYVDAVAGANNSIWKHIEPSISIPVPQQQKHVAGELSTAARPTKRSRRGPPQTDSDIYSEATALANLSSAMGLLSDVQAASMQICPPDVLPLHVKQRPASPTVIRRDISSLSALQLGSGVQGIEKHVEAWRSALRSVVAPFDVYKGRWWIQENGPLDEQLDIPASVLTSMVAMALHRPQGSTESDAEDA